MILHLISENIAYLNPRNALLFELGLNFSIRKHIRFINLTDTTGYLRVRFLRLKSKETKTKDSKKEKIIEEKNKSSEKEKTETKKE